MIAPKDDKLAKAVAAITVPSTQLATLLATLSTPA
jgi:hypothetical protein